MANITAASLHFEGNFHGDLNTLLFRVDFTIQFRENEAQVQFEEAARLREHDPDDDDLITAYPLPHKFNAGLSRTEDRFLKIVVLRDQTNTEIGTEELQGEVWLRRVGNNLASSEVITPILKFP
jgi:hypothetical protein